jgi:aryl-alcohol dehydrogenase-like predicted oxidoreductase
MGSRYGKRESLRALDVAYDSGITLFDTARSYGQGDSERMLGAFLRGKRHRVVVSTKFGINAPKSSTARRLLKAAARQAFRVAPRLRYAVQPQLKALFTGGAFSVAEMSASVDMSLSELRTDYIDVLFLHGCDVDVIDNDELFAGIDDLRRVGKVRVCGIASSAAAITYALRRRRASIGVVQFHHNLFEQADAVTVAAEPASIGIGIMAHQPFGGGDGIARMRKQLERMHGIDTAPVELRKRLTTLDGPLLTDLAINAVFHGTRIDAAIGSMFTPAHVRTNAAVTGSSRFSDEELQFVQQYFRESAAA